MIHSAGILLYRLVPTGAEVLIAHMGGPFWARKDAGAWSLPKGEYDPSSEQARDAAFREFREELGLSAPDGPYLALGSFAATSGKRLEAFACEAPSFAVDGAVFGTFDLEWPPRSGRTQAFPEVDRVEWTSMDAARERLVKGQRPVLDALLSALAA